MLCLLLFKFHFTYVCVIDTTASPGENNNKKYFSFLWGFTFAGNIFNESINRCLPVRVPQRNWSSENFLKFGQSTNLSGGGSKQIEPLNFQEKQEFLCDNICTTNNDEKKNSNHLSTAYRRDAKCFPLHPAPPPHFFLSTCTIPNL